MTPMAREPTTVLVGLAKLVARPTKKLHGGKEKEMAVVYTKDSLRYGQFTYLEGRSDEIS